MERGVQIFPEAGEKEQQGSCPTPPPRRGTREIEQGVSPATDNGGNDEQIRWELPVDRNMTEWNKTVEEPTLDIEYSAPPWNGIDCGWLSDCTGVFRFYYSNNQDGMDAEVNWPVINMTENGPNGEGGEGGGGSSLPGGLPGFGLAAGLGSLALAAVAGSSRLSRD